MFGEIVTEKVDLFFVNEVDKTKEGKQTVVGKIKDVPKLVEQLLDLYDREGKLSWHDGTIPEDEIWAKVGGDHGGGIDLQTHAQLKAEYLPSSDHCLL